MKTALYLAATGAILATAAPTQAQAQSDIFGQLLGAVFGSNQQASEQTLESDWSEGRRPLAQRSDQLDARIDSAVQNGSLRRDEADSMRREYDDIVRLEEQYAADGSVSQQQRSDLRMRYRALMQRAGGQRGNAGYDANNGNWQPLSMRNAEFEQRLNAGVRNRSLTQADATRLRSDWRNLGQVEASYQRGGLDARERADLEARYDGIDARLGGSAASVAGFGSDRNPARWTQLETRLVAAERNGSISRNEATMVRAQLGDLARLDAAYSNGGYATEQRTYLRRRYADLDTLMSTGRR